MNNEFTVKKPDKNFNVGDKITIEGLNEYFGHKIPHHDCDEGCMYHCTEGGKFPPICNKIKMIPGIRYIVTKPSDDGTFELNDHIGMNDDGSIMISETGGWLTADAVEEATKGMEVVINSSLF